MIRRRLSGAQAQRHKHLGNLDVLAYVMHPPSPAPRIPVSVVSQPSYCRPGAKSASPSHLSSGHRHLSSSRLSLPFLSSVNNSLHQRNERRGDAASVQPLMSPSSLALSSLAQRRRQIKKKKKRENPSGAPVLASGYMLAKRLEANGAAGLVDVVNLESCRRKTHIHRKTHSV